MANKFSFLFSTAFFLSAILFPPIQVRASAFPLSGAQESEEDEESKADHILSSMSLEQKVDQMFIITPEALTGVGPVTQAGETTKAALSETPVGGLIYMAENLQSRDQIIGMLSSSQRYSMELSSLPLFLCVDEEGGSVRRLSGRIGGIPDIPDMWSVGQTGDITCAGELSAEIATYLSDLGFNVDFAPVADVVSDPSSSSIGTRSFGSSPGLDGDMAAAFCRGFQNHGIYACLKHFPGHGSADADSHSGTATVQKSLTQLKETDLVPFRKGIDAGAQFVMAGHISCPAVTGDDTPASLSHLFLTDLLRGEMNFRGIIVTDALAMGAVSDRYSSGDAAVMAVSAGADILLMPADFQAARQGLMDAVKAGTLEESRIDASVRRIVLAKLPLIQDFSSLQGSDSLIYQEDLS